MGLKDKLQNLLNAANNTTGKNDTNLTDGIKSLIEGYGHSGSIQIETIDDFYYNLIIPAGTMNVESVDAEVYNLVMTMGG